MESKGENERKRQGEVRSPFLQDGRRLALIRLEGVTGSLGQTVFPNASPGIDGGAKPFALHQIPYLPLGTKRLWLERTWRRKKVWSNFF